MQECFSKSSLYKGILYDRHRVKTHHPAAVIQLGAKFGTPLAAAHTQNGAAGGGAHARPETMVALALDIARLKCSFHDFLFVCADQQTGVNKKEPGACVRKRRPGSDFSHEPLDDRTNAVNNADNNGNGNDTHRKTDRMKIQNGDH